MDEILIKRIKQIKSKLGFNSDGAFADHIHVARSNFSQMMKGNRPIGDAILNKIHVHTNTSKLWLETGEGSMFLSDNNKELHIHNECSKGVPYYNIDITLGMLETFETVEVAEYYVDYKPFNDCTAYLPVYGDSMFPRFKNGEVIAVKQIANFDVILWGEAYLIITNPNANSLKTVKLLFQHPDEAKVILRASNPSYAGDTVIPKEDILAIYSVRGKISRDFI